MSLRCDRTESAVAVQIRGNCIFPSDLAGAKSGTIAGGRLADQDELFGSYAAWNGEPGWPYQGRRLDLWV